MGTCIAMSRCVIAALAVAVRVTEADVGSGQATGKSTLETIKTGDGRMGLVIVDRNAVGEPLRTGKVFAGSPAEKAGVKPDWFLISVNGTNVVRTGLKESMAFMSGPPGSKVTLDLADATRTKTNTFTFKRGRVVGWDNSGVIVREE